ncbi:T9SS type A sorting domain-containing protein [Hymenobacter sp.]|uniref:DUF7619 domain-containing protein n=1 Tax=Hymenobacter sp. TaxID=1898978 RepID=UPI00286CDB3A|nr:T9SS type A sorting domain-containing protein [Hymenobacter sp.]
MKLLQFFLLLTGLLLGQQSAVRAQVVDWAQLARGSDRPLTGGTGSATDLAGNTYAVVSFRDTLRVGTQVLLATAGNGAVVKYDSTGQVQWVQQLRNILLQNGIAVDPANGGIFVLGQSLGGTWGGVPVTVSPTGSFFAKCSAAGTLQWVTALPLLSGAYRNQSPVGLGGALTADGLGNCYVMGNVRGTATLAGTALDSTTTVVLQANAAGAIQWTRIFRTAGITGPTSRTQLQAVALGAKPSGGCVVMGYYSRDLYFSASGPAPVLSPAAAIGSSQDSFIGNLDVAGSLLWAQPAPARTTTSPTGGNIFGIAADAAGNCYATGRFGNGGFGLAKYNAAGVQQWLTASAAAPAGQTSGGIAEDVAVDDAGNITAVVGTTANSPTIAGPLVVGTLVLRSPYNIVRFNGQGQAQWAVADDWQGFITGSTTRFAPYLEPVSLGLDEQGNVYYSANVVAGIDTTAANRRPAIMLGSNTLVGRGLVVARVGVRTNTISGALYLDQNGNGQLDAGDTAFPQTLVVQASQPTLAAVGSLGTDGKYRLYAGPGAYTVAAPVAPTHYVLSQPASGSYAGNFGSFGNADTARHFGYRPLANQADLRATLTPYGAARPGFITRYRLTVENVGTTTVASGTATVTLDGRMAYVSSTPAGSRAGQTVTWDYANLAPFGRREFDVLFSLPTNTTLGTQLATTAAAPLAGDVAPDDNTAGAQQTVTGSFDPNDIEVNYARLSPAQVAARQPLDYTIRFQNMGTDTAFTVVLSDTLDFRKLDVASLQLVAQSHNCLWSLSGTGLLTVRFLNIQLPYRNQDVIRSQGFVRFRVQPRTTLAVGEIIPNHARIYFDYNDPVRTNTATTAVLLPTATLARHTAAAWEAYPNPATDAVTVAAELATAGPVRLELLDALGRPVRRLAFAAPAGPLRQLLDLRGLAPGLYVLRVTPPNGPTTSHQVLHE